MSSRKLSTLRVCDADDGTANRTPSAWMISLATFFAHGQIVFFVWVDFRERKWSILAERRRDDIPELVRTLDRFDGDLEGAVIEALSELIEQPDLVVRRIVVLLQTKLAASERKDDPQRSSSHQRENVSALYSLLGKYGPKAASAVPFFLDRFVLGKCESPKALEQLSGKVGAVVKSLQHRGERTASLKSESAGSAKS